MDEVTKALDDAVHAVRRAQDALRDEGNVGAEARLEEIAARLSILRDNPEAR